MSNFREYIHDNVLFESTISEVKPEEISELLECLNECEARLDELLGLGKLASGIKKLSDKGDKKAEELKTAGKEFVEKGKDVVTGMAKEIGGDIKKHASEVAKSHVEIAKAGAKKVGELSKEAKEKFVKISGQSREAFKKMFTNISNPTEDQKKVMADLEPLFAKLQDGKQVSGADGLRILASVMASDASGAVPSYKNYIKKLETLRTTPMLSSFKVGIKKI